MLQPDDVVCGFVLLELLGGGGNCEVWRARRDDGEVALKLWRLPSQNQDELDALHAQTQTWVAASQHPNLLPLSEAGVRLIGAQQMLLLASEYHAAGSLQHSFTQSGDAAWEIKAAVGLADGLLRGLAALHERGLRHGNLKPANIFLDEGAARLTDFGLGRIARNLGPSETPDYLAPEAWDGDWTEATDLWAAGVILYRLLAGRLPFQQPSRRETMRALLTQEPPPLPAGVPPELCAVVETALQKEPERRYASAEEMRQALLVTTEPDENVAAPGAEVERLRERVAQLEAQVARLQGPPALPEQPAASLTVVQPSPRPYFATDIGALRQVEPLGPAHHASEKPQTKKKVSRVSLVKAVVLVLCAAIVGFAGIRLYLPTQPESDEAAAVAVTSSSPVPLAAAPSPESTASAVIPSGDDSAAQVYRQPVPGGELRLVLITRPEGAPNPGNREEAAFYLGETEVTRGLWRAMAQQPMVQRPLAPEPWRVKNPDAASRDKECDECPVEKVSWQDTQEFLARLNALPGAKLVFRLPTVAEWTAGCGECRLLTEGNIKAAERSQAGTVPVKSGPVNEFGLYEMYGNVWEWCQDPVARDPERRALRGASFRRKDAWAATEEDYKGYVDGGFRVAATPRKEGQRA